MRRPPSQSHLRNRYLLLLDALFLSAGVGLAFALRFESVAWPLDERQLVVAYAAVSVPARLFVFYIGGLYRRLWRHASVAELERIFAVGLVGAVLTLGIGLVVFPALGIGPHRVPLTVATLDALLTIVVPAVPRLYMRVAIHRFARRDLRGAGTRVLVVGAGLEGQATVKELLANPRLGMLPIGYVDDDEVKRGHLLQEVPVLGPLAAIDRVITEFQIHRVLIALPDAIGSTVRDVTRAAAAAGAEVRIVPGLSAIIGGRVSVRTLRPVQIEDLLRRAPVETDVASIRSLAEGHTILVTGAGGSIGSELCRQLATLSPRRLVLLGRGENSIFEIERELAGTHPSVERVAVIADVRDRKRLQAVFAQFRPDAVFHAAAHKHVPLMEADPAEAVSNNVIGTWNVAEASVEHGVRHFVLISTDKAVRPTSAMGASKRAAELVVQAFAAQAPHDVFVSVRFGNVLGSRGSVVPTFLRQIEAGGPITITHPDMRRYFMTIPEAVRLVLHAGARGRNGDVFVLDMGEPVRISDLAADLVRLSGLEVGRDIEIIYTGIRPGEKLYEEPFFDDENASPTDHPKILRAKGLAPPTDAGARLSELMQLAHHGAAPPIVRAAFKALLPDYAPNEEEAPPGTTGPADRSAADAAKAVATA